MNCLFCSEETTNPKFCNSSCSAKYNNSHRHPMPNATRQKISQSLLKKTGPRFFKCLQCGDESDKVKTNRTKFCGNKCFTKYQWENVTKPKIESGNCGSKTVLKKYLVEKHGNHCSLCTLGNIWNEKVLVFHLDHVDGNSDNNFPYNLRLVCPNCHSQTDTYCNKARCKKETKRNRYLRKIKGYSLVAQR